MQSVGTHGDSYSFPKRKAAQFRPETFFVAVRSRNSETAQLQRKVPERVVGSKTHPPPGHRWLEPFLLDLYQRLQLLVGGEPKKASRRECVSQPAWQPVRFKHFTLSE